MAGGIGAYSNQDLFAQDARRRAYLYANQPQAYQAQAAMQPQYMDEMSVMAAQQPSKVSQPEGCTDGKDDGKIGFWQGLKHFGKGIGKFFTGLVGFDKDGNWSAGRLLKNVAIGAGIAAVCVLTAGTAVPAVIAAIGAYKAGDSLVNSGIRFFTAKTDAEARAAAEGMGTDTLAFAASVAGLKAAKAAKGSVATTPKQGFMGSIKSGWNNVTSFVKHPINTVKSVWNQNASIVKNNWTTLKNNWKASKEALTIEGAQKQKVSSYETKINSLTEQMNNAKNAKIKADLQQQITKLTKEKDLITSSFDEVNNLNSFAKVQSKISNTELKIAKLKKDLSTCKDATQKAKLTEKVNNLETQLEVFNRVAKQKVSQARNLNSQIESLKKLENKTPEQTALLDKYTKQLDDMKFEMPKTADNAKYVENSIKASEDLKVAQTAYDKAKAELSKAEGDYKSLKSDATVAERTTAQEALNKAKFVEDNAARTLRLAEVKSNRANAYQTASSGYDYIGTSKAFLTKAYNTVNNTLKTQYGSTTLDIPFANAKIPYINKHMPSIAGKTFGKYTVPSVSIPNYVLMTGSIVADKSVDASNIDEVLLAQMGYSPEQIKAMQQEIEQMNQLAAMQQAVPQGYMGYPAAQAPAAGQAPTMADFQQLDAMLRMYGIA